MLSFNFTPFPTLTTENLCFRQLTFDDANEIFRLRSDERVNKFIGRNPCKSLEDARSFINKVNRNVNNNESAYWGITFKDDNKLIGTICLWNIQPENYRAEIGYELHPDYWGKGVMKEAIPKIVQYAFDSLKLHSLAADVDSANSQSVMLLEKTGFIKEGHFKESTYLNGKFSDRAVYSLVNTKDGK